MTYAEALAELEAILADLREGKIDIDALEHQTQRATELIQWCQVKLRSVGNHIQDLAGDKDNELF